MASVAKWLNFLKSKRQQGIQIIRLIFLEKENIAKRKLEQELTPKPIQKQKRRKNG